MKIEMIAFDLDGTVLLPDHLTMSDSVKDALQQAHDRGIYVVPVTGRPCRLLPECLAEHPLWEKYGILCNGADIRCFAPEQILAHWSLEEEILQKVLKIALQYDLPVEFNSDGHLYLTHYSYDKEIQEPRMEFHCREFIPRHGILVDTLESCCCRKVEKIHVNCIPQDLLNQVKEQLALLPVSVVSEKPCNLEVTHLEATKGKGLKTLCSHLKIPLAHVMALGDSGNDLSMLETAGFPVVMGNAPEYLKKNAAYVTGTNLEDGAADAIRRFALV